MTKNENITMFETATGLSSKAVTDISDALRQLLADVFTLYLKTKNFHWHITGRHFRDYHLLLDEQAEQIFSITDEIAERARKIGGYTLRSIGEISRHQRLKDNDSGNVAPHKMLSELRDDNSQLIEFLRRAHEVCGRHGSCDRPSEPTPEDSWRLCSAYWINVGRGRAKDLIGDRISKRRVEMEKPDPDLPFTAAFDLLNPASGAGSR
jgi:starvation-inducible DNA-binding protein